MRIFLVFLFLNSAVFLLSSCSNPLGSKQTSFVDANYGNNGNTPSASTTTTASPPFEIVPSAIHNASTTRGRKISAVVGAPENKLQDTTTNGKKVYYSVEGQIISK